MADVKLVVMYPHPKDVDAFEKIYQTQHVPLAVAKLGGKSKMVATKVLGSPQGTPPLPHCRGLLSFNAGSGSVRCFGRRERSPGTRGEDFFRGNTNLLGGRRVNLYVFAKSKRLGEKHHALQVADSGIGGIFDSNDTLTSTCSCCGHGSEASHR